jgi:hypothetical protein
MPLVAPVYQNFVRPPAKFFENLKTVDLNDAIDHMAALLDKPIPDKKSHCLEKIDGNDCIVDNDGGVLGLGIVKPKIKPRVATQYDDEGPEEWRESK